MSTGERQPVEILLMKYIFLVALPIEVIMEVLTKKWDQVRLGYPAIQPWPE